MTSSGSRRNLFDSIFMMQSSDDVPFLDQVMPLHLLAPSFLANLAQVTAGHALERPRFALDSPSIRVEPQ